MKSTALPPVVEAGFQFPEVPPGNLWLIEILLFAWFWLMIKKSTAPLRNRYVSGSEEEYYSSLYFGLALCLTFIGAMWVFTYKNSGNWLTYCNLAALAILYIDRGIRIYQRKGTRFWKLSKAIIAAPRNLLLPSRDEEAPAPSGDRPVGHQSFLFRKQ